MSVSTAETYNDKVVRQFAIMTVVSGIVGMAVGVLIAAQLYWPALNFDIPWLTYSRLRPLHTNAVIFAFGGCALIGTSYYVVQRTSHVRLFGDKLAAFTFWGWQAVIVAAAISLPLGMTQGKDYAELEWPIDILITIVWVMYAVVFFTTSAKRRVQHIRSLTEIQINRGGNKEISILRHESTPRAASGPNLRHFVHSCAVELATDQGY
jgi:cytochrome c oxidase cbb3-type subunit 1